MSISRLQRPLHNVFSKALLSRAYATTSTYVPTAQLVDVQDAPTSRNGREKGDDALKPRPAAMSFYTTKPEYYDQLAQIEAAIKSSRKVLTTLQLLPLPEFAQSYIPPAAPAWKDQNDMSSQFGLKLTTTRYRKITGLLSELDLYRRIAATAECQDLSNTIGGVVSLFESGAARAKLELQMKQQLKRQTLDQYGRSYTVGKRKTSSARVWIIPTKKEVATTTSVVTPTPAADAEADPLESIFGKQDAASAEVEQVVEQAVVTPTTVLVNNLPLAEYFPVPADREKIIRPIKLAGVLGGYHVFAIARGGGTSGQSGAIAHGIAKGIAIHEPSMEPVLRAGASLASQCVLILNTFSLDSQAPET